MTPNNTSAPADPDTPAVVPRKRGRPKWNIARKHPKTCECSRCESEAQAKLAAKAKEVPAEPRKRGRPPLLIAREPARPKKRQATTATIPKAHSPSLPSTATSSKANIQPLAPKRDGSASVPSHGSSSEAECSSDDDDPFFDSRGNPRSRQAVKKNFSKGPDNQTRGVKEFIRWLDAFDTPDHGSIQGTNRHASSDILRPGIGHIKTGRTTPSATYTEARSERPSHSTVDPEPAVSGSSFDADDTPEPDPSYDPIETPPLPPTHRQHELRRPETAKEAELRRYDEWEARINQPDYRLVADLSLPYYYDEAAEEGWEALEDTHLTTPGITSAPSLRDTCTTPTALSPEDGYIKFTMHVTELQGLFAEQPHDYNIFRQALAICAKIGWKAPPGVIPADIRGRPFEVMVRPSVAGAGWRTASNIIWRFSTRCNGLCTATSEQRTGGHEHVEGGHRKPCDAVLIVEMTVKQECTVSMKDHSLHLPAPKDKLLMCRYIRSQFHDQASSSRMTVAGLKQGYIAETNREGSHASWIQNNAPWRVPKPSDYLNAIKTARNLTICDLQTCLPTWAQDRGKICAGSARLVKRNHLSSTLKLIGLGTRVADTSEEEGEGETNGEGGGLSRERTYNT